MMPGKKVFLEAEILNTITVQHKKNFFGDRHIKFVTMENKIDEEFFFHLSKESETIDSTI